MNGIQQMAARAREISQFCRNGGGRCFAEFDGWKLRAYVAFHLVEGTLFEHREDDELAMVAFAWRDNAAYILRRTQDGRPHFTWELPHCGDSILVAEVIGSRRWLPRVMQQAMALWPDSPRLRLFTHRWRKGAPVLTELTWPTLTRLAYGRT